MKLLDKLPAIKISCIIIGIILAGSVICAADVAPVMLDVRQAGAVGDGIHDDTAAIQTAIDDIAVTMKYGGSRGKQLVIPDGVFKVNKLLVKCDIVCRGVIDGDVEINGNDGKTRKLVLDGLNVTGNLFIVGSQDNMVRDFFVNKGIELSNPENKNCCYNVFSNGRTHHIKINATGGWVNANTFSNILATAGKSSYSVLITGKRIGKTGEAHANIFRNCDFSYSLGICNNSDTNQFNILDGVYYEGSSSVYGNWHLINCHSSNDGNLSFPANLLSNQLNVFGTNLKYGAVADYLAASSNNLIRGGDYSQIVDGLPQDFVNNAAINYQYVTVADNPCGGSKLLKISCAGDKKAYQEFAPFRSGTGFISGVLIYKGGIVQCSIVRAKDEDDGSYFDEGRDMGNGWKLLRFSRYVPQDAYYKLRFLLKPGGTAVIGGLEMTAGAVTWMPQTSRTLHASGKLNVKKWLKTDGRFSIAFPFTFEKPPVVELSLQEIKSGNSAAQSPVVTALNTVKTGTATAEGLARLDTEPGAGTEVILNWTASGDAF